jgi:hypothetical protein
VNEFLFLAAFLLGSGASFLGLGRLGLFCAWVEGNQHQNSDADNEYHRGWIASCHTEESITQIRKETQKEHEALFASVYFNHAGHSTRQRMKKPPAWHLQERSGTSVECNLVRTFLQRFGNYVLAA